MGLGKTARTGLRPPTTRAAKVRKPGGAKARQASVARTGGMGGQAAVTSASPSLKIPSPPGQQGSTAGGSKGKMQGQNQNHRGE
jgi:hypothetical protein